MSLDTALNTNSMGGIISDMTKKQREATEAQAGMDSAVAKKTTELRAPLLKEQEQAIGAKESQISQVGQEMTQPFVMPKETANDMATYGSMVGLIGVMLGASGKNSGMNQLAALTGLAKGYREGRKDLVDKSYKEFEVNQKRLQGLMQQAKTELDVIMQKYKVRDESVVQNIAEFKANYANSIAAKIADGQSADKVASLQMDIKRFEQQASEHAARIAFDNKKYNAEQERYKAEQQIKNKDYYTTKDGKTFEFDVATQKVKDLSTGQIVDPSVLAGASKLGAAGRGGAAGDRFGFTEILATASNEAASTMRNIMGLDINSSSGLFGGKSSNNLFTAPLATFTNVITPESAQRYNVQASKLSYNLSQLLKGGRVVNVSEVAIMDEILKIKEGDTLETAATRIAEARQVAERAIEVRLKSPNTPQELKEVYEDNLKTIQNIIPFTVDDINNFVKERDQSKTFGEEFSGRYKNLSFEGNNSNQSKPMPDQPKPMPENEKKLQGYADAYFDGDINEARKYLESKGYK